MNWHFLPKRPGLALDVGAGRGILSFALASEGWQVVAVEPDPGDNVGVGSIRELKRQSRLPIEIVRGDGEHLSFSDGTFDLVCCRQVMHHVSNPAAFCLEVRRVLGDDGMFAVLREPVISCPEDMDALLDSCILHRMHEGENAYALDEYRSFLKAGGFDNTRTIGSMENAANYFPMDPVDWHIACARPLIRFLGYRLSMTVTGMENPVSGWILRMLARRATELDARPGRMYSFIARKTGSLRTSR